MRAVLRATPTMPRPASRAKSTSASRRLHHKQLSAQNARLRAALEFLTRIPVDFERAEQKCHEDDAPEADRFGDISLKLRGKPFVRGRSVMRHCHPIVCWAICFGGNHDPSQCLFIPELGCALILHCFAASCGRPRASPGKPVRRGLDCRWCVGFAADLCPQSRVSAAGNVDHPLHGRVRACRASWTAPFQ